MKTRNFFSVLIVLYVGSLTAQSSWQSARVFYQGGKLTYTKDSEGNKIPDFSYAGYKNSKEEIPDIPVVLTISAVAGDNTQHIQNALNQVGNLPLNANGFRGALLLEPGLYQVNGTLTMNKSGVVLRGSGDNADTQTNTVIFGKGNTPAKRTILIAGGGGTSKWSDQVSGSRKNITSDTVYTGDREFFVESSSPYAVGDNIIIFHPSTESWLQSIDYGGTHYTDPGAEPGVDLPWSPGSENIVYNRYITAIDGYKITVDAPVFYTLIKSRSQSYIYKYGRAGIAANIGVENLRIDIETAGGTDENHAWQSIDMFAIEDAWVRNCTMLHFGQSAVRTNTATRITVDSCKALDPVSLIEGERRYNYHLYNASQLVLVKNSHASNGRHHFVSNGYSYTSGCVFLNCTSSGAYTSSEGHRRWSTGLLWDNITELDGPRPGLNPRLLALYNRGHYGTSHGWAAANSVAWNCNMAQGTLIVQKPPTAQNYAIGCFGSAITGQYPSAPFNEPQGYIEGSNTAGLNPKSLFLAQLQDRLQVTSIDMNENSSGRNKDIKLLQNYPNPFNPVTRAAFILPEEGNIRLLLHNVLGETVSTLFEGPALEGHNEIEIDGTHLPSGLYFYSLYYGSSRVTKKMILQK